MKNTKNHSLIHMSLTYQSRVLRMEWSIALELQKFIVSSIVFEFAEPRTELNR